MKKEYTCIVCPKSCKGCIDPEQSGKSRFDGFECKRGETYAENEYNCPQRMLTTTVSVQGAREHRLAVVSDREIDKAKLKDCLDYLYSRRFTAPIKAGEMIALDILGTGANIVAARDLI
jgi:CxxC motif-containing protein